MEKKIKKINLTNKEKKILSMLYRESISILVNNHHDSGDGDEYTYLYSKWKERNRFDDEGYTLTWNWDEFLDNNEEPARLENVVIIYEYNPLDSDNPEGYIDEIAKYIPERDFFLENEKDIVDFVSKLIRNEEIWDLVSHIEY